VAGRKNVWMLHWLQALLPGDDRFFELFAAHSRTVVAGARGLRALLEGGDVVPKYYRIVMDRERDADGVTRDILIAVRRSFITPFDRGAIKDLITAMDDAIDQMEKTAKAVRFDIRSVTPEMKRMAMPLSNARSWSRRRSRCSLQSARRWRRREGAVRAAQRRRDPVRRSNRSFDLPGDRAAVSVSP